MQYFQKYPEVFRVLLRNKYFYSFHAVDNGDVRGTVLEDIVAEEAIQNKGTFTLPLMADKEFFRKLLAVGNISCILENYHQFSGFFDKEAPVLLSEEESSQLIASIKNDIALQNSVLETLKSFVFDNPALLQFYLHSNSFILERTINYLNHHENLAHLYTDELYHEIKEYYALKYHLNLDKLDQLESTFGPTIIRFFDNDNLQRITCLEDKKFAKLIALFPKTEYSLSLLETAYDSLKQYAFSKENSDIISIFAHIKHSVQDGTEEYKTDLENLLSVMDEKFYKRFGKKYPNKVEFCKANPREFLEQLIKQIESQNPEEKGESLVTLHTITDYFIATKREQYREKYNMIEELKLPYEIDRKDFEKKVTDYLMQHDVIISYEFNISISSAVIAELVKGGMQPTLAQDVVNYYLKKDVSFSNDISVIQKNVRFAIPIMKRISLKHIEGVREEILISKFDQAELLKRNYYAPKSDIDPYQILTALRIDSLENNLLEDSPESEVIYQSLLHTMEKYKLHKLPSCFRTLLKSDSVLLSDDLTDVAGFISYYHQVYESEKKKLESQGKVADNIILSFTNVLINASVLSSASSVYNQFLGTEDTRLVKANPGPNYATEKTDREVRLKEAVEWTLKNFKKTEVTIPTFSEVVPFEDKQLRVVVGNFTHPSNITHGERTGACMRIGGIGESLFTFCLEDKNGFHIRFVDEKTGEYISRVSGFRNGNTVFLNELRHSCNTELYNDEEIIEACKKISSTMIEMSKDSTCPIENVFVARAYATENLPEINLGISNNKKGLKAFYSDIQTSGVLLATTEEPFARIELDKENAFMTGKAVLSINGLASEKEIKSGHNEIRFQVEPSKKYTLNIKATYDLDSNTILGSETENKIVDDILETKVIELVADYKLSLNNIKTYNDKGDTKYFGKSEPVKVSFESTNATNFEPIQVLVNGTTYNLTKVDNAYHFTINSHKTSGVKTAKIEKVILSNSKEIILTSDNEIKVTVLKDKPTVEQFGYKENLDGTITATFNVVDLEQTITNGKVVIINRGTTIKEQTLISNQNNISFVPRENESYTVKIIADYDLDMNVLEEDANEYKEVTLLEADITLGNRKFEVKDIIRTLLYRQTENGVEEVQNLKESDLANLDNYIIKVRTREMPAFYTTISGYRIEDNKLKLTLDYDNVVQYTNDNKQDKLEIVYGDMIDGTATNISLESLLREMELNPTGTFTLDRDYDASIIANNSSALVTSTFMGTLNGNGHKIYNLSKPLFDSIESATIENLTLQSPKLSGPNSRGTIASIATNSTIRNVHIKREINSLVVFFIFFTFLFNFFCLHFIY